MSSATNARWLPASWRAEPRLFGLIREAWQRRRRRRVRFTVTLVLACLVGGIAYSVLSGASAPAPPPSRVGLRLALAQTPYVGVSCPAANVTTCGRVGIAVWLARPGASEVDAVLAGTRVRLGPPPTEGPGQSWRGFVHLPVASMGLPRWWAGSPARILTLQLRVRYGSSWREAHTRVWLSPGWG